MAGPACTPAPCERRKPFWATTVCGHVDTGCDDLCATVGLRLTPPEDRADAVPCPGGCDTPARSVYTDDYIRGLAYNILLTDGPRQADRCGFRPGLRGGHWSQAYVRPGYTVGSSLRQLQFRGPIRELVPLARAAMRSDLAKLVTAGVVRSIDVTARYLGGNRIALDASLYGDVVDPTLVGVVGARSDYAWLWSAAA